MSTESRLDAATLEVLRNALDATAEEMGAVLRRTAFSPNIKERMDASCAIFDRQARLVAQAEHVPVHLGSMLSALGPTLASHPPLLAGDVLIVNDPFIAGAHLPDVLFVSGVFVRDQHLGYVAARAHHSDIGGMEPGSMPGNSREIWQEGLVIPPVLLFRAGRLQSDVEKLILANVRTPLERRGDLNAQLACLRVGERRLAELAERYGSPTLLAGLDAVLDYAERRMRKRLAEFPAGTYRASDVLDDDGVSDAPVAIEVAVTIADGSMLIDFAGSAAQCRGNINAVAPMTHSAVYFSLKMITDPSIPANAGTFRPVEIRIPAGSVLHAARPAAVCAGNTETTQRVADVLLRALAQCAPDRVPAAGQGTMNLIGIGGIGRGGQGYAYVETIGGGQGGRPMGAGQDGIQVNMTNTMNTPVEALEIGYPLRVERYAIRDGSGGAGRHRGGHGVIREITALEGDARVSLQSDRRRFRPYGLNGGEPGQPGRNLVRDSSGVLHEKPGKVTFTLHSGETVIIETPGGGGWGEPR